MTNLSRESLDTRLRRMAEQHYQKHYEATRYDIEGLVEFARDVAALQHEADVQIVQMAANSTLTTDPERLEGFNAGVVALENAALAALRAGAPPQRQTD